MLNGPKSLAPHLRSCSVQFSGSATVDVQCAPTGASIANDCPACEEAVEPEPSPCDVDMHALMGSLLSAGMDEAEGQDGLPTEDEPPPASPEPRPPVDLSGRVVEPSNVELPGCISQHMFRGDGLNPSCLMDKAMGEKGVRWVRNPTNQMDEETKMCVELLKILKDKDLRLFDQVIEWKFRCDNHYKHTFNGSHKLPTRSGVLKKLRAIYGHEELMPERKKVWLPNVRETAELTTFPFQGMLLSLLTDPFAVQPENLSFPEDDPFRAPVLGGVDDHFDGIETGSMSCTAHERFCTQPNDILCELILFIDKTHLDVKGRHTVEPVMFTLGIFNRSFRNQHRAWRPLGFIPNIDSIAPHATADQKQEDKGHSLRILLSEMVSHQTVGGLDWQFTIGEKGIKARLQIPVNTVMGDGVGFEWLLGKVANKGGIGEGGRLCRQCDVKFDELGLCDASGQQRKGWHTVKASQVRRLRNRPSETSRMALSEMGYKMFHDGMVEVHFSDPVHALHGCTPPEVLHAFQLGLAERAIELLLEKKQKAQPPKGKGSGKRKRSGAEEAGPDPSAGAEPGQVFDGSSTADSKFNVFSAVERKRVDGLVKILHGHLRRQSDRDLPRTDFAKHGTVNGLAKMQGHERTGVLLVLLCVMVMDHWALWRAGGKAKRGEHGSIEFGMKELASNVVKTLSLLIELESFMRSERIHKSCLKPVDDFIPALMDQFLRTFDRTDKSNAGNNLIKNHYPYHLTENIKRGGSPQNSNSSIGESLHITAVKRPGRRTNMHGSEFEPNTGERYVENVTIDRSCDDLLGVPAPPDDSGVSYDGLVAVVSAGHWTSGSNKKMLDPPDWVGSLIDAGSVFDLIRKRILPQLEVAGAGSEPSVAVYSSTTREGTMFRANPQFANGCEPKQEWALVEQPRGGPIPHQLLCILKMSRKPKRPVWMNGSVIDNEGFYAIAHSAVDSLRSEGTPLLGCQEGTLAHVDQDLIHRIPKAHYGDEGWVPATNCLPPSILFVPCDSIAGVVTGFPDLMQDQEPATDYFFIRPHSEWADAFVERAKSHRRSG